MINDLSQCGYPLRQLYIIKLDRGVELDSPSAVQMDSRDDALSSLERRRLYRGSLAISRFLPCCSDVLPSYVTW